MSNWFNEQAKKSETGSPYWTKQDAEDTKSTPRSRRQKTTEAEDFFKSLPTPPPTVAPPIKEPTGPAAPRRVTTPNARSVVPPTTVPERREKDRDLIGPRLVLAAALALVAVAGVVTLLALTGLGDDEVAGDPADEPTTTIETVIEAGPTCPELGTSLEQVNAATYVVAAEYQAGRSSNDPVYLTFGTAWAVDDHVLVTNAHVTQSFIDLAEQGIEFERVLAVQAGTGRVMTITRELTHPNYDGNPLQSPDVGLFTTLESMPAALTVAPEDAVIALGDDVQIVGFPGDVTDFIEIIPGETVPQATSLSGRVTARRTHDDSAAVTDANLDVIQHQAPTTPGTSGSSLVSCGRVIGVNNAGTVKLVAVPGDDGQLDFERQAAAANNFAVHHRHIETLLTLFENNAVQGTAMPPKAASQGE